MAFERLEPDRNPLDRNRQCRGDADRDSAVFWQSLELCQRPVDFNGCWYRIYGGMVLGERHRLACRQGGRAAARRRAIVEIAEAALGRFADNGLHHGVSDDETPA